MTTTKLTIAKALTDTLKTITPANGYVNDMADFDPGDGVVSPRVFRGRGFFGEGDPVPMLSILEAIDGMDYVAEPHPMKPVSEYWWGMIVQGWIKDDPLNPTDPAYLLLGDVRKRLALEVGRRAADPSQGAVFGLSDKIVKGLRFNGGTVRPAHELSAYAGFHLLVEVLITDKASEPAYGVAG